jgi:hypothetical protein
MCSRRRSYPRLFTTTTYGALRSRRSAERHTARDLSLLRAENAPQWCVDDYTEDEKCVSRRMDIST